MFEFNWRKTKQNDRLASKVLTAHFLGSVEIAQILAGWDDMSPDVWHLYDGHAGRVPTRTAVEEYIRLRLHMYGSGAYDGNWPPEDERPDYCETIASWAAAQVRRIYRSLDDDALDAWLRGYIDDARRYEQERRRYRDALVDLDEHPSLDIA